MNDDDVGGIQERGSWPSIHEDEHAFDDWGVDWIQTSRQIRDDESGVETMQHIPDPKRRSDPHDS
jgi:hypothetical protein